MDKKYIIEHLEWIINTQCSVSESEKRLFFTEIFEKGIISIDDLKKEDFYNKKIDIKNTNKDIIKNSMEILLNVSLHHRNISDFIYILEHSLDENNFINEEYIEKLELFKTLQKSITVFQFQEIYKNFTDLLNNADKNNNYKLQNSFKLMLAEDQFSINKFENLTLPDAVIEQLFKINKKTVIFSKASPLPKMKYYSIYFNNMEESDKFDFINKLYWEQIYNNENILDYLHDNFYKSYEHEIYSKDSFKFIKSDAFTSDHSLNSMLYFLKKDKNNTSNLFKWFEDNEKDLLIMHLDKVAPNIKYISNQDVAQKYIELFNSPFIGKFNESIKPLSIVPYSLEHVNSFNPNKVNFSTEIFKAHNPSEEKYIELSNLVQKHYRSDSELKNLNRIYLMLFTHNKIDYVHYAIYKKDFDDVRSVLWKYNLDKLHDYKKIHTTIVFKDMLNEVLVEFANLINVAKSLGVDYKNETLHVFKEKVKKEENRIEEINDILLTKNLPTISSISQISESITKIEHHDSECVKQYTSLTNNINELRQSVVKYQGPYEYGHPILAIPKYVSVIKFTEMMQAQKQLIINLKHQLTQLEQKHSSLMEDVKLLSGKLNAALPHGIDSMINVNLEHLLNELIAKSAQEKNFIIKQGIEYDPNKHSLLYSKAHKIYVQNLKKQEVPK